MILVEEIFVNIFPTELHTEFHIIKLLIEKRESKLDT